MQYLLSVIHDGPDLATSDEMAAIDVFNDQLRADGHWVFELEADATIPSEYVLLRHYLAEPVDAVLEAKIANYLRRIQGAHGGWPLVHDGPFDMSASVKAYFALKMIGHDIDAPHMKRAREAILARGGADTQVIFLQEGGLEAVTPYVGGWLALGSLVGFCLASGLLVRGRRPLAVAAIGAGVGIPAFGLVVLAALLASAPILVGATVLAGFGAGLFGHGTLTATMRSAPHEQIGLALGAWGAVQTTAAGTAIAVGGVIRDVLASHPGAKNGAAAPYIPVFVLEMALLAMALVVVVPLLRARLDTRSGEPTSQPKG